MAHPLLCDQNAASPSNPPTRPHAIRLVLGWVATSAQTQRSRINHIHCKMIFQHSVPPTHTIVLQSGERSSVSQLWCWEEHYKIGQRHVSRLKTRQIDHVH